MKILIADDEPLARKRLASFVRDLASSDAVSEAADGAQALRAVELDRPDIVLLDICMPGVDGLDLARRLNTLMQPPVVIITTAYDNHALQAYEVQAIDYLLKPVRREQLALALARAKRIAHTGQSPLKHDTPQHAPQRTHLSASYQGTLQIVPITQIRYFRAEHKYVTARFLQGMVLIEESFATLADEFKDHFLRVHRSALVALSHIEDIERDPVGRQYVHLNGIEDRIRVSRRLNAAVRRRLKLLKTIKTPPS